MGQPEEWDRLPYPHHACSVGLATLSTSHSGCGRLEPDRPVAGPRVPAEPASLRQLRHSLTGRARRGRSPAGAARDRYVARPLQLRYATSGLCAD